MAKKKGTVKEVSPATLRRRLKKDDDERRSSPRVEARLEIEVPLSSWDQFRRVYTKNISKGGLLFTLAPPASLPGELTLTLTLPDAKKVRLPSEVRHTARVEGSQEFEVGVQFGSLDEETLKVLEAAYGRR